MSNKDLDNAVRLELNRMETAMTKHHLARLAMMMALERGEDLSYEKALEL